MLQKYLEVGKITNTHGLMGEVRVQPWADSPEFLCKFKKLYLDNQGSWGIKVEHARPHKNMAILKLENINDIPSAVSMKNAILYIDRDDAKLPKGSFFIADLMGIEVRDAATGEVLGKIADVRSLPASNIYVVQGGEREILIPAVDAFIAETNVEEGYIRVNMIEGL
jgi:16S rRNA processing protein RimM